MKKKILIISLLVISFCFGFWTAKAMAADYATTTMTITKTGEWWPNSTCASPPAVVNYEVTERMSNVKIKSNGLSYFISPGNTFEGGWARLWAFWSNNGGRTWISSGWDYTTNNATFKSTHGYGTGNDWVGQAISTICDQSRCPKDPNACNGRKRSNIIFVPNPDSRAPSNNKLKIFPEDVGVFYETGKQQFKAFRNNIDVSNNVDWYIEDFPFVGQPNNVIEINSTGLARVKSTWGRANIKACFPKGCNQTIEPPKPEVPMTNRFGYLPGIYLLITDNSQEMMDLINSWPKKERR